MDWTDAQPGPALSAAGLAAALKAAAERHPHDADLHLRLGEALLTLARDREAVTALDQALTLGADPHRAAVAVALARAQRKLGRADGALATCERAALPADAAWQIERAEALLDLGLSREAHAALRAAIALGENGRAAMLLLASIGQRGDGAALLAECDALGPAVRGTAAERAYRALAFSLLGRAAEARALIDLDHAVMRVPFDPPAQFGGIEAFNRTLVQAITGDPPPAPLRPGVLINYRPRLPEHGPFGALRRFVRQALLDYAARPDLLAAAALPPAPDRATISWGTVVLSEAGRNGQHIHPTGYLSTVYHVAVPPGASGEHGALELGRCTQHSGGHEACWGRRVIPAEPGWLTVFPSHFFHDVVPTGTAALRVSVIADLEPRDG